MTEQEIALDRSVRVDACKAELEAVLEKHQFALTAVDNWTPNTKVSVEISFVDRKKYEKAELAQPVNPVVAPSTPADTTTATPVTDTSTSTSSSN